MTSIFKITPRGGEDSDYVRAVNIHTKESGLLEKKWIPLQSQRNLKKYGVAQCRQPSPLIK